MNSKNYSRSYLIGFVLSLICTVGAYAVVTQHLFSADVLVVLISVFALAQFLVQIVTFLHIGKDTSKETLLVLAFAILVAGLMVGGSLWIIQNLNNRMMMSPEQMQLYMHNQPGL